MNLIEQILSGNRWIITDKANLKIMSILWQYPNPEWVPVSHCDKPRYESIESVMARWDWDKLIWGKVRQLVFNLQKRIYKATKSGRYKKAKSLMYLLQNSYYASEAKVFARKNFCL
ncbi:hypothetical protein PN36_31365 [Candidatus Thiomargarita nelsonii]|uniref:Reverse transcriptase N-terminal domain-containing protein n=1 Tax=Candidatus Thiomargarita nelsonii TaxID=1003181 RepID=A0A4E0QYJ9_9GAMM|nr:hypothetical protein PN36_31365 [Candidatus Thiomargarita nelsonii]